jgi:hypothetical protein
MWWQAPAVYPPLRAAGALLEVSLNETRQERGGVGKRRRRLAPVRLVNAGLALLRCGVRYLEGDEWARWERALHAATTGAEVERRQDGLWTTRLPGVVLARYLAGSTEREAAAALEGAFDALGRLHQQVVRWPDGVERTASHSDATANNALWDAASGRASWFDFETLHEASWPAAQRRVDDLRALVFSAARVAEPELVVRSLRAGYPDASVSRALPGHVRGLAPGRLLFHLSQSPLSRGRLARVLAALEAC